MERINKLEKQFKIKQNMSIFYIFGLFIILQMFFSSPFKVFGFQFEWAFFLTAIVLLDSIFKSRRFKKQKSLTFLALFLFYSIILGLISFFRFNFDLAFIGFTHLIRAILLFVPFFWILSGINDIEKTKMLIIIRYVIIISSIVLTLLIIIEGNLYSGVPFKTLGISNKNSLGYTVICFALFLSKYENKDYIKRPIPKIVWMSVLFFIVYATKSGTAFIFMLFVILYNILILNDVRIIIKILVAGSLLVLIILLVNDVDGIIYYLDKIKMYKIKDFLYALNFGQNSKLDTSNYSRFQVQLNSLSEFDIDMAIGRFYYYYFAIHGYTAHQQYIQILYDTGVLGISLFIGFIISIINQSRIKMPVILIFLYSFIENFLIQFIGLIILALLIIEIPQREGGY